MVFEYMDHDLAGLLNAGYKFSVPQIRCLIHQLLEVLDYLHTEKHLMHRDIKCSNLLVGENMQLKLADFGLARFANREDGRYTNRVITLWYRPPELLLGEEHYSYSVDIWSVGCIMAELLLGSPAFQAKKEMDQLEAIWAICGTPTEENWPDHKKLPMWNNPYTPKHAIRAQMKSRWKKNMVNEIEKRRVLFGTAASAASASDGGGGGGGGGGGSDGGGGASGASGAGGGGVLDVPESLPPSLPEGNGSGGGSTELGNSDVTGVHGNGVVGGPETSVSSDGGIGGDGLNGSGHDSVSPEESNDFQHDAGMVANSAIMLLGRLLALDPSRRFSARAAKEDAFFMSDQDSLHWQNLDSHQKIDTGGSFHEWETKQMLKELPASKHSKKLLVKNKKRPLPTATMGKSDDNTKKKRKKL